MLTNLINNITRGTQNIQKKIHNQGTSRAKTQTMIAQELLVAHSRDRE
jgi:hypothetical protein